MKNLKYLVLGLLSLGVTIFTGYELFPDWMALRLLVARDDGASTRGAIVAALALLVALNTLLFVGLACVDTWFSNDRRSKENKDNIVVAWTFMSFGLVGAFLLVIGTIADEKYAIANACFVLTPVLMSVGAASFVWYRKLVSKVGHDDGADDSEMPLPALSA